MLEKLKIWWLKYFDKRVVMVVFSDGTQSVREVQTTKDEKSFIVIEGRKIGFLDNPLQKSGEFRKALTNPSLVRWFDV
jgi:hypothetical protein